jgi:GntR family transcriptional regulator, transcriptional repressor for pyruvate dehydrogenase complex
MKRESFAVAIHPVAAPARTKLSDSIVRQIERLILEGHLKPGDSLPPEREFSKRLGVSRPSLREAILKMQARGLVQALRAGGYAISDVTAPTLTDPLVHLLQEYPPAAFDILELRHGLEEIAAYFAAIRATKADRALLKRHTAPRRTGGNRARDPLLDAEADAAFHLAVADASHNVALVHVMRGIFNLIRGSIYRFRDRLYTQKGNYEIIQKQHQAVADAIIAGDSDAARQAAHLHLTFVGASLRELAQDEARVRPRPQRRAKNSSAKPNSGRSSGGGRPRSGSVR